MTTWFIVDEFSATPIHHAADNPKAGCLLHSLSAETSEPDGTFIVLCHGTEEGFIPPVYAGWAREENTRVVCCHPNQVRARYPDLDVVGDWSTGTRLKFLGRTDGTWAVQPYAD